MEVKLPEVEIQENNITESIKPVVPVIASSTNILVKSGWTTVEYDQNKQYAMKTFKESHLFNREQHFLKKLEKYGFVPEIVDIDKEKQTIKMKYCGVILNARNKPTNYIEQLKFIDQTLQKENIFHNDVELRNFVTMNDKIYLIDFAFSSFMFANEPYKNDFGEIVFSLGGTLGSTTNNTVFIPRDTINNKNPVNPSSEARKAIASTADKNGEQIPNSSTGVRPRVIRQREHKSMRMMHSEPKHTPISLGTTTNITSIATPPPSESISETSITNSSISIKGPQPPIQVQVGHVEPTEKTIDNDPQYGRKITCKSYASIHTLNRELRFLKLLEKSLIVPKIIDIKRENRTIIFDAYTPLDVNNLPIDFEEQLRNITTLLMRNKIQHNSFTQNSFILSKTNKLMLLCFHNAKLMDRPKDVLNDVNSLIEHLKKEKRNEELRQKANERLARVTTKQQAIENHNKQTRATATIVTAKTRPRDKLHILQDRYNKYKTENTKPNRKAGKKNIKTEADFIPLQQQHSPTDNDGTNGTDETYDNVQGLATRGDKGIPINNTPSALEISLELTDLNKTPTNTFTVMKSQNKFKAKLLQSLEVLDITKPAEVVAPEPEFVTEDLELASEVIGSEPVVIEALELASEVISPETEVEFIVPEVFTETVIEVITEPEVFTETVVEVIAPETEVITEPIVEIKNEKCDVDVTEEKSENVESDKLTTKKPRKKAAPKKKVESSLFGNLLTKYK